MQRIYLEIPIGADFNNIEELLTFGFTKEKSSMTSGFFTKTYYDPGLKERQCRVARRSLLDLLAICQTYFPDTTVRDVARCLYKLHETIDIIPYFCNDVHKIVFRCVSDTWETYFKSLPMRNFAGADGLCYNDIMYLIQTDLPLWKKFI